MADAPYRDDRDADQARIASLEAELASATDKIAELEGKRSQALVLAGGRDLAPGVGAKSAAARWFGAPMRLDLSRTWDKEFPVDKLEELVDLIRDHTRDNGRVELLKTSLMWTASSPHKGIGPFHTIRITVRNGTTKLDASDRLNQLAGVIFGAFGGGVGGGLIVLPIFGAIATAPVLAPVFIAGWLGAFFAGGREAFKRSARKRAQSLLQLFEMLEREIIARLPY